MYPHDSYLRIEGNFKTAGNADVANNSAVAFINNGLMRLFSNARYILGGEVLEYFENAGITTTIHNYLSKSRNYSGDSWFWAPDRGTAAANATNKYWRIRNIFTNPQAAAGVWYFSAILPLNAIFSFCNDYKKAIYGMQHKISLTRTNNTSALLRTNAAIGASGNYLVLVALANDIVVSITTLKWAMRQAVPSLIKEQEVLSIIEDKEPVQLAFLNKRLESTNVPAAASFKWNLQLASGVERPRFIVVGFQTGRGADQTTNNASFDLNGLNVTDAYIVLNGLRYPYSNFGANYATKTYTKWYYEYLNFYNKYNNDNKSEACLSYYDFITVAPLYVFDVSNQRERTKNSEIDVTLTMTFAAAAPANTMAYAATYYDSTYTLTGDVGKQIIKLFNYD